MPARPVAQKVWDGSTATGAGATAYFGEPITKFSILTTNASTKAVGGSVQGTMANSSGWVSLLTLTTDGSTGTQLATSTGSFVVDKLRLNVTGNASTGLFEAYVAGA